MQAKGGQRLSVRLAVLALAVLSAGTAARAVDASRTVSFMPAGGAVPAPGGAMALCRDYSWACSGQAGTIRHADLSVAAAINQKVNRKVRPLSDQDQYGRGDVWSLPTARGGDCEDFALLKKREMIRAGFPAGRLLIATALNRQRVPHAVLVVRTDAGDFVMDNLDDRIRRWSATGYIYLRMQDPGTPGRWKAVGSSG